MLEVGKYNWKIIPLLTHACDKETICEFEKEWVKVLNADLNTISPLKENNIRAREFMKKYYRNNLESKKYYCELCNRAFG